MEPNDTTFEEELSPEELEAKEKEFRIKRDQAFERLASEIEGKFKTRSSNRSSKELEWLDCTRLYYGALYGEGGSTSGVENPMLTKDGRNSRRPEVNIVSAKCDIAVAQCVSMQFSTGERNWDLFPAANETSPENTQKCFLMAKEIETQLDKSKYGYNSRLAITDRVILGTGVLKGPVNTGRLSRKYVPAANGEWLPVVDVDYSPSVSRVNPWFFYPDDSTNEFCNSGDAIELHPMSAVELKQWAQHEGFRKEAIAEVLKIKPVDYVNENFVAYAAMADTNPYLFKNKYCVMEYHGPISEDDAMNLGLECTYDSPSKEYFGEVWVVNGKIIRIELENIEASFEVPYAMSVWKRDPSSVFGYGMPLTMRDAQRVATQTWHMILDNSSISSGPQAAIQKRWIQPADGKWEMAPRKVWNLTDPMMKVQDAIQFFFPPNITDQLIPVLQLSREFAEEESSAPLFSAGLASPDNQESATGQLITKQASTVLLDFLAEEWDDHITQKVISRMYAWNMQYSKKPEIKGNYVIDVRSSTEYKNKQLYIRDIERLSLEATNNPEMAKAIKMDQLTRVRLEMMHIPDRTIIRNPDEVKAYEQQMAQQPNPDLMKIQVELAKLEAEKMKMELDAKKLEFELNQQQQRELWEHEEKMAANYARTVESQAMVMRAQTEKETELIKLAAHSEVENMKQEYMMAANLKSEENKLFMKTMEENRKERENMLFAKELEIKVKQGSGI